MGMGLRMKSFNIMGFDWKMQFFCGGRGGGGHEKQIYRGKYQKRGAWTVCRLKGAEK